jgi:hypothetical protein
LTLRDPKLIKTLIPAVGAASWITLLMGRESRRKALPHARAANQSTQEQKHVCDIDGPQDHFAR